MGGVDAFANRALWRRLNRKIRWQTIAFDVIAEVELGFRGSSQELRTELPEGVENVANRDVSDGLVELKSSIGDGRDVRRLGQDVWQAEVGPGQESWVALL